RASGGLGLGLSIVKHLAELHGGGVELSSPGLDAGTTARVWLPLQPTMADGSPTLDSQFGAFDDAALAGLSGRRVLVVEDDRDAAEMLGHILEDRGAQVRIAGDHDSGLAALQARRPDLLLSDIGLPGKDGYALIRQWRTLEVQQGLPRLPAIALTAFGRPDDRAMALDAGFDMHVAKPFAPQVLLKEIQRLVA
ncbi:response regulator, partial [Pseudorhodoferax soli]